MSDIKNETSKILELCDTLPDCCQSFLMETDLNTENSTRIAYARELGYFFDYLIYASPDFCDKTKSDILISDIKKITSQDVSRYLATGKGRGLKARSLARKRASLSSFFAYLTNNRLIDYNPVLAAPNIKIPQDDTVLHLNMDEQINLLKAVDYGDTLDDKKKKYHERFRVRDYALILLLLDTGLRVSELRGIDIADIDFDNCSVMVTRKGNKHQNVYFSNESSDALSQYIEERKTRGPVGITDPLFVSLKGDRLTVRAIEKLVKKYTSSAIPGAGTKLSPHKMRSSFAMEFYRAEKDILALQKKLGHKSIAATNIYAKATDETMKETRSVLENSRKLLKSKKNF